MLAMLAAVMLAAAPQHDTVFTADGGRVVGTVVEESGQTVAVQLPDGSFRRLPRRDVVRIEYGDGSVSNRPNAGSAPPAAAAPPRQPPPPPAAPSGPPAYTPPPPPPSSYPPPYYGRPVQRVPPPGFGPPPNTGPISPFFLNLGIGGMFYAGHVEHGFSADGTFGTQLDLNFEGGVRLNPHLSLGVYGDIGLGGPGDDASAECRQAGGGDCSATTSRVGGFVRYTFNPYAHVTPWLSLGSGYSHGSVDFSNGRFDGQNFFEYSGWEISRLMAGVDFRTTPVFGFGFYTGVSFTEYTHFEDNNVGSVHIHDPTVHTMFEAGIRMTLFP